jgi:hypothetical protein
MPLSSIQSEILRLLASHRDPESYVAGSTPLNRSTSRFSGDIDIFHDREERVREAAELDSALLEEHGFALRWHRRDPLIYTVFVERSGEATKLEWVADSDYRFFPTVPDEDFGFVLHPVDLATNKVAAAYGRREPRDIVDLLAIHERILPLGAAIWASVGKSLGFTPEGVVNEIRRTSRYTKEDFNRVASEPPIDPAATMIRLRELLNEAEAFVARMPTEKAGLLFLENGRVVQPDPDHLDRYETHAGQRRGHWPASSEITSAMLERYIQKPIL